MILLLQVRDADTDDAWNDMQIPVNKHRPPVRGEPTLCETPDEVAVLIVDANLEGVYRLVLDNGEMWLITVKPSLTAEVTRILFPHV